jgi:hypothetical protein
MSHPCRPSDEVAATELRERVLILLKKRYLGEVSHTRREAWEEAIELTIALSVPASMASKGDESGRWVCTCKGRDRKVWHADDDCPIHGERAASAL